MNLFRSHRASPVTFSPDRRCRGGALLGALFLLTGLFSGTAFAEREIYAFTVYCNAYPGSAGAINDSVSADKLMVDSIFTEFFSEQAWKVELRKQTVEGTGATRDAILKGFREFVDDISEEDTVFVHFSGHGVIPDQQSGEQFLQSVDGELFSRQDWADAIDDLPCRLKILITDCCSSYPVQFEIAEGDEDVEPWKNLYSLFLEHTGFVNITAASPGQAAYGTKHGGFLTINLVSDLQRYRSWEKVFEHSRERVVAESAYELERAGSSEDDAQRPFAYSLGTPAFDAAEVPQLYVMPDSNIRKLDREELERMGLQQLYLARNEIFARFGYDFSSPFLRQYFEAQSWYQRAPGFKSPNLSQLESENADLILAVEKSKGGPFIAGNRLLPDDGGAAAAPDIFAYSSERSLSRALLQNLTPQELSIARNEIYARHGYPFTSPKLRDYFGRKPYYRRNESISEPDFNDVEQHNLWLIRKIERINGGAYRW